MSHLKERTEKNCLNCNAEVKGRYCQVCGQENVEPYETAWQLIVHFVQDIFHYDGKFISSVRYLLTRPGMLTQEYMAGRRASYLHPIRMYIFVSAVFFIIFFSMKDGEGVKINSSINGKTVDEIGKMDSATFAKFTSGLNKGVPMTREGFAHYVDSTSRIKGIHFSTSRYSSRAEYDSVLRSGKTKHNWIEKQLIYKEIDIQEKYHGDQVAVLGSFKNIMLHSFPQILFLSLPFFALLLKLLYIRRRQFFYVSHGVFGLHFYVFVFLMLFVIMLINALTSWLNLQWLDYLIGVTILYMVYYQYKALRVFYGQGRGKTLLKFLFLNIGHLFIMTILLSLFVFFSLLKL